jgi:hypothetical protein
MLGRIVSALPRVALATGIITVIIGVLQVRPAQSQLVFCISMSGVSVPCDYNIDTPQNNNYDSTTTVPVYEYSYQRQQKLLQKAITQGQSNQNVGTNNLNTTLPDYFNQLQQRLQQECENSAYPAYDETGNAYSDSAGTFAETYQTFVDASNTPYIYDQLQGQNKAFANYSSAQQQFADANQLDSNARGKGLRCQAAMAATTNTFLYNNTQVQSQNLTALGQLQEQMSAQQQEANMHKAQAARVTNGFQNTMINALNGMIPKTTTSYSGLRPTKY